MDEELNRIMRLAGLNETDDEHDPEQATADAAMEREMAVEKKLKEICAHLKLPVTTHGVYFQDSKHVHVTLEDEPYGYPLKAINALSEIASDISVAGSSNGGITLLLTLK